MQLKAETKAKLVKIGGIVFPVGIALLLLGTGIQIAMFIMSEGDPQIGTSHSMTWAAILAALGIPAIVGGWIMRMIGTWEHEDEEETADVEPPGDQNV